MLEIGGTTTQATSGRPVVYHVQYSLAEGNRAAWSGRIALLGGHWHALTGGFLADVSDRTIAWAVRHALDAEIDLLDLETLARQYGQ